MGKMIIMSVDVTQVDKARLKEVKKTNGQTAKYLELVLMEGGNYGDYIVRQQVSKEERQRRVNMPILGNAKCVGGKLEDKPNDPESGQPPTDDDVPF